MSAHKLSRLLCLALVAASLVAGCSAKNVAPSEPTAGNWSPILLASNDARRIPPPPAANSETQKDEIVELLGLQNQRTAEMQISVAFWEASGSLRWNEIARDLVSKYRTDPQHASRVYALLSVAQYDALVAAWNNKYFYQRPAPEKITSEITPLISASGDPVYPSEHAVLAAASAAVLTYLYPQEEDFLAGRKTEEQESRLWAGVNFRSDLTAGEALGRDVAQIIIDRAQTDGSDAVWAGTVPIGDGYWFSDPAELPLVPLWGQVKPWLMTSGDQFRPGPPPAYSSPEFKAALAEVKQFSETRTPDQSRAAAIWADNLGTYTPPGHWNAIAAKLIQDHHLTEIRAARALALLNMALMDAGIACFDSKYHYWLIRPSQVDPSITTPVGLPNFPSYISGHATFSGAAAAVLGYLFPAEKARVQALAEEAALSRLYGGIHYRFDNEAGLAVGRAVGELAVARGQVDGAP